MQKLNLTSRIAALLLAIAPAACVAAPTSASRATEIAEAQATYTSINRYVSSHPLQARYFANISEATAKTERWREFIAKSPNASPLADVEAHNKAIVRTRRGRTMLATCITSSPSGDWTRSDDYFFRDDGTLAKMISQLSTVYSEDGHPLAVMRIRTFNPSGRVLSTITGYKNLKTGETKRSARSAKYFKNEPPVYGRVSTLPFHALLQKPRR